MLENLKEEHEITLRVTTGMEELEDILNQNGYKKIEDFILDDIYMVPEKFKNISKYDEISLLNTSIRIRSFIFTTNSLPKIKIRKEITKKVKKFDNNNIINESKYICRIESIDEAYELLKSIGYVKLLQLKQDAKTYSNGKYEIVVSDIDGKIYLELENKDKNNNILFETTQEMIEFLDKYNIPHFEGEYFAQKAGDKIKEMKKKQK